MTAVGDWIYLTGVPVDPTESGSGGLQILHVADSVTPTLTAVLTAGTTGEPWNLAALAVVKNGEGRYAYLGDNAYGLRVIDLADRSHPVMVGTMPITNTWDLVVVAPYLYLVNGYRLVVVDIAEPVAPRQVGSLTASGHAWSLAVRDSFAYLVEADKGLSIIDVSEPHHPKRVGFYRTMSWANDVAVAGDYIYVADYDSGLIVLQYHP